MFLQPEAVKRSVQQVGQLVPGRLPVGGINARDPLAIMPETDAIDLINVLVDDRGLGVRKGYQWWAWDLPGNRDVPTIMSYYPATAGPSGIARSSFAILPKISPRAVTVGGALFACTNNNIYNITDGGGGPWVAETNLGTIESDYWTWRNFQNAGGNFLLACNNAGGYIAYSGGAFDSGFNEGFLGASTGFQRITFGTNPGQISPVNPDLFVFLMVWKRRLWFIEKNTTRAWYLPVEQITGVCKQFDFGSHFRHGGYLIALANWTLDAGEGIDDYLVAVSSEGDVVIFKGYDPDNAAEDPNAFALHGIWYVGPLPQGFRNVEPYGGDVYILSALGVTPLSKLVAGSPERSVGETTEKINPLISKYMKASNRSSNWYLKVLPREELLVIGLPLIIVRDGINQLGFKVNQKAWSRLADQPIKFYTNHDNLIFAGGDIALKSEAGGKVFLMYETAFDNVSDVTLGAYSQPISCRIIPAYSGMNTPGLEKVFPMVRVTALVDYIADFQITVLTNYRSPAYTSRPSLTVQPAAYWDVDIWDVAKWSGEPQPLYRWLGTSGSGLAATCQLDFTTAGTAKITNIDWFVKPGGVL